MGKRWTRRGEHLNAEAGLGSSASMHLLGHRGELRRQSACNQHACEAISMHLLGHRGELLVIELIVPDEGGHWRQTEAIRGHQGSILWSSILWSSMGQLEPSVLDEGGNQRSSEDNKRPLCG